MTSWSRKFTQNAQNSGSFMKSCLGYGEVMNCELVNEFSLENFVNPKKL